MQNIRGAPPRGAPRGGSPGGMRHYQGAARRSGAGTRRRGASTGAPSVDWSAWWRGLRWSRWCSVSLDPLDPFDGVVVVGGLFHGLAGLEDPGALAADQLRVAL